MKRLLLTTLLCTFFAFQATAQITCTVKGTVVDRPESKMMYLNKPYEDFRITTRMIEIKDGRFEFTIQDPDEQCYVLAFQDEVESGGWRSITFCTFNGTVEITLHPMADFKKNRVIGGSENEKIVSWQEYLSRVNDSLFTPTYKTLRAIKSEERLSDYGKQLKLRMDTTKSDARFELYQLWSEKQESGEIFTAEVQAINARLDSIGKVATAISTKAEMETLSIYLYSKLISQMHRFKDKYSQREWTEMSVEDKFKQYAKKYPKHTYTQIGEKLLKSMRTIQTKGKYVDFTAPDLDGNMISLSSQIKGKIAIIDLWASWCGPCRENSKSYIPIYEEYKDRGFTVVGVAREKDNDKAMRKAIERDGYKWLNLTEINDRTGVWGMYGLGNGGGGVVMVDRDGTILAKDPTADEVREILETKIKK